MAFLTIWSFRRSTILDSLDPAVRDQLLNIFNEVTAERNAAVAQVDAEARQAILDAGGVIRELDDETRALWLEAMSPVWGRFAEEVGQDNIDAALAINDSM